MITVVEEKKDINYRNLVLRKSPEIFHRVLQAVLKGERRFHIINPEGEGFDMVYEENNAYVRTCPGYHEEKLFDETMLFPSYLIYDENDKSRLLLDIFTPFEKIYFMGINEYNVMLAWVLLKNTEKQVVFKDSRIKYFLGEDKNLLITSDFPKEGTKTEMLVTDYYVDPRMFSDAATVMDVALFHDVFFIQWLAEGDISGIKYIELTLPYSEGIGGALIFMAKLENICESFGWKVYIRLGSTRYQDEMLNRYLAIFEKPEDATEENTVCVCSFFPLLFAHPMLTAKVSFEKSIFTESFEGELEEYRTAVMGNRRFLGLLIRGTDYEKSLPIKPYSIEELTPILKEKMKQFDCERIFLATEDQDKLDEIIRAFPGQIIAISQNRLRVSEMDNAGTIYELEKNKFSGKEYIAKTEDMTVNYLYAVYMLSHCVGFITTPPTNAFELVMDMNKGRFEFVDAFAHFVQK